MPMDILQAIRANNLTRVKEIVQFQTTLVGSTINYFNKPLGRSPLVLAAELGHRDIVGYLLQHKYDVNDTFSGYDRQYGEWCEEPSALYHAVKRRDLELVSLLLSWKACVRGPESRDPMTLAIVNNDIDIIKLFIAYHNIPSKNSWGMESPLHLAIRYRRLEICKLILDWDPSLVNKCLNILDKTPLVATITDYHVDNSKEMVILLLSKGADINLRDRKGRTPLHRLAEDMYGDKEKSKEMIQLLIDNGADPSLTYERGYTPEIVARCNKNSDLANLIRDYQPQLL